MLHYDPRLVIASVIIISCMFTHAYASISIEPSDFLESVYPLGSNFTGTQPWPDRSGMQCGENAAMLNMASPNPFWLFKNDTFLKETLPGWRPTETARVTFPWRNGFSSPRLLGGIATVNVTAKTYTPNLQFEVVRRNGTGFVYNFTRIYSTLDGFVYDAKIKNILVVLDNVPFAFVKPENRYYCQFGLGSAPDDPEEFAAFVKDFVKELVKRYGYQIVSTFRFRLGTEADGPRYGPPFANFTAPNPPFVALNGRGGNFTSRKNGLDVYVETYIAVSKAVKSVVPLAGFGPSNFASVGSSRDGIPDKNCAVCPYVLEFLKRIFKAGAPLDYLAASDYSHWDKNGFAPAQRMADAIWFLSYAHRMSGFKDTPIEVHEWGWAGWGKWQAAVGEMKWPMGVWGSSWGLSSLLWQRNAGCRRVYHWAYNVDSSLNKGFGGVEGAPSLSCMPNTTYCTLKQIQEGCQPTCRVRGYPIITGFGYLLTMLEDIRDMKSFEFVRDIPYKNDGKTKMNPYNYTVGGIKSLGAKSMSYIITFFSPDSTERAKNSFELKLSKSDLAHVGVVTCSKLLVRQKVLNRTTSVHDVIEKDLYSMGMKKATLKRSVDSIGNMATPEGLQKLKLSTSRYMELNRRSLRSMAFDGKVRQNSNGGCSIDFDMETPSLKVLQIFG